MTLTCSKSITGQETQKKKFSSPTDIMIVDGFLAVYGSTWQTDKPTVNICVLYHSLNLLG